MVAPPRALSPSAITRCRGSFGSNGTGPSYPGNRRILVAQRFTCLNEVTAIGWIVKSVESRNSLFFCNFTDSHVWRLARISLSFSTTCCKFDSDWSRSSCVSRRGCRSRVQITAAVGESRNQFELATRRTHGTTAKRRRRAGRGRVSVSHNSFSECRHG
jgi:hypothetical protein